MADLKGASTIKPKDQLMCYDYDKHLMCLGSKQVCTTHTHTCSGEMSKYMYHHIEYSVTTDRDGSVQTHHIIVHG